MAPPLVPPPLKLQKYFLFSCNHDYSTPIALGDVVSSNNVVEFNNISSASSNQQPKIDVPIINSIYFLCIESSPLGSPLELFGIDARILFPPLDMLALKTKNKRSYDLTWKFQVEWVAKLPWVELQVGSNGCVHTMKCKMCSEVE
jgi:hypothetical protein